MKEWIKKHSDTMITLGVLFGMITWFVTAFSKINDRFNKIEKDLAIIKAILIMKNIIPQEAIAKNEEKKNDASN